MSAETNARHCIVPSRVTAFLGITLAVKCTLLKNQELRLQKVVVWSSVLAPSPLTERIFDTLSLGSTPPYNLHGSRLSSRPLSQASHSPFSNEAPVPVLRRSQDLELQIQG